jgi:hypothetical protein
MRHIKIEDQFQLYINYGNGYKPTLYNLIIKGDELVLIDEDGYNYWFVNRSQKGIREFLEARSDHLGETWTSFYVEDFEGNPIDPLDVLTSGAPMEESSEVPRPKMIPIELLEPNSPTRDLTPKAFKNLKKSIKKTGGIETPIHVLNQDDKFKIIDGTQRYKASKELGYGALPCKIMNEKETQVEVSQ